MNPAWLVPRFCDAPRQRPRWHGPVDPPPGTIWPSIYAGCLNVVRSRLAALGLPGMNPANVVVRRLPWTREFTVGPRSFPAAIVSPAGGETIRARTNRRAAVDVPIRITFVEADAQRAAGDLSRLLYWRQRTRRCFHDHRWPGEVELLVHDVELPPPLEADALTCGLLQASLIVHILTWEPLALDD